MTKLRKLQKAWNDIQAWVAGRLRTLPPWAVAILLAVYEACEIVLHYLHIPHWHP